MKTLALPLIALPLCFLAGCGSSDSEDSNTPRPDASTDTASEAQPDDAGAQPDTSPEAAEPDAAEDGTAPEAADDAAEDGGSLLSACGTQPALPNCSTTTPAPTQTAEIEEFVMDNAVALRCVEPSGDEGWDFETILAASVDSNVIMTGEVHGSDEIGPTSAALLKSLARADRVDMIAIEMPMEWSESADEWVLSGTGFFGDYIVPMMAPAMMWRALPTAAKELHGEGITLPVAGVDVPYDLGEINTRIEAIAAGLDPEVGASLLEGLPPPVDYQTMVDQSYIDAADAYYQHIVDNQAEYCATLDDRACLRLEAYAWSLYVGGFQHLPGFMEDYTPELMQWFEDRERLIFMNYQYLFADGSERIYAHMGAYHTGKSEDSVAQRLDEQFAPTQGRLFTLTCGYGPNSTITYGGELVDLDAEPTQMSSVLVGAPSEVHFLSSVLPSGDCVGNPFTNMAVPNSGWGTKYGTTYDGIVFYRQLHPEGNGAFRAWPGDPRSEVVMRWQRMKEMEDRWARERLGR